MLSNVARVSATLSHLRIAWRCNVTLDHEAVVVLNRVGLSIGFLSFWFAAPEFIGEERLGRWEQNVAKALWKFNRLPQTLKAICLVLPFFAVYSFLASLHHWTGVFGPTRSRWDPFSKEALGAVMAAIATMIAANLDSIIQPLANDSKVRQRALFIGAVLFTLSFVLQFVATYGM